jgi:hypothetical protein
MLQTELNNLDTEIKQAYAKGVIVYFKFLVKDEFFPELYQSSPRITSDIRLIEFTLDKEHESKIPVLVNHLKGKYPKFFIAQTESEKRIVITMSIE